MTPFALIIKHRMQPGKRDAVRKVWEKHMAPAITAHPGHTAYFYCIDNNDPDSIYAFQQYLCMEASQELLQTRSYAAYLKEVEPLLAGPPRTCGPNLADSVTDMSKITKIANNYVNNSCSCIYDMGYRRVSLQKRNFPDFDSKRQRVSERRCPPLTWTATKATLLCVTAQTITFHLIKLCHMQVDLASAQSSCRVGDAILQRSTVFITLLTRNHHDQYTAPLPKGQLLWLEK